MIRDVAQFGSALGSGPRGRWFKSSRPDQKSSGQRLNASDLLFYLGHKLATSGHNHPFLSGQTMRNP